MNLGAIFDWDGVIINSSRYHRKSWERLAEKENKELPPYYFKKGFGMRNQAIIPDILKWATDPGEIKRLADRKEQFYREIMIKEGISALPGVKSFLETLRRNKVKIAVASSTPRLNINTALSLLGLEDYFQAIVAAEDVARGKPDPQVFLLAAQKIDLPPERCVVFEDAYVGIEAAHAAGMKVVAVVGTNEARRLIRADLVVNRLDELSVSKMKALFL